MQVSERSVYVDKKQLEVLYQGIPRVLFGLLTATFLIIWVLIDIVSMTRLLAWLGMAIIISVLRLYSRFLYLRSVLTTRKEQRFWFRIFIAGVIVGAVWWGLSGIYFFTIAPLEAKYLLAFVYCAITSTAIIAYLHMPVVIYLFTGFSILPVLISLLLGNQADFRLGVILGLYIAILLVFYRMYVSKLSRGLLLNSEFSTLGSDIKDESEATDKYRHHFDVDVYENRYWQLVQNTTDMIFHINDKGDYIYVNRQCADVTGFTQEELLQKKYLHVVHPDHRQRVKRNMLRLYTGRFNSSTRIEFPINTKDGKARWLSLFVLLVKSDQEKAHEFHGIAHDTTQKTLSLALLESARLKEEQLLSDKNDFINNITHELRTPLHVINGTIGLLGKSRLDNFQRQQLHVLKVSSNQMLSLINDVLDLSRIEMKKIEFVYGPLSIQLLMDELMLSFEQLARKKNIELSYQVDKRIPEFIIGDYYRLLQILVNLVSNAVKYTRQGRIAISADLKLREHSKLTLQFGVNDTGIGISAHEIDKIFDKFQQTQYGAKATRSGTGLGLSIVKRLVEMQGGSISVNSVINKGSTFLFDLSFDKLDKIVNEPADTTGSYAIAMDGIDDVSVRILVVDDNDMVNRVVSNQVKQCLHEQAIIDNAANGRVAVELVQKNTYQLILMDLQMPVMDGTAAARAIRNLPSPNSDAIIVALSAANIVFDDIKEFGFDDSLPKPFNVKELSKKIVVWLGQGHDSN